MTGERKPGHPGDEDDRAAVMARELARRGWPAEFARQAAEGAAVAGYPEERPFWDRVADEMDALRARERLRVVEPLDSGDYRR